MKKNDSNNNDSIVDDELTVKQLVDGLEKLEQWNPVATPSLQWFQHNIELEKKRIRKKQWKNLLAFVVVAVLLLSVVITVVYRQPVIFLYFQFAGIMLLPFALNDNRKKVSNE